MSVEARFWPKVRKGPGCWEWVACRGANGYGRFSISRSKWELAHRASWTLHNGPIPDGLCVLHDCDNPACVRPDHLFLGTNADNTADMDAKGRRRVTPSFGEAHGKAKLTEGDVRAIRADSRPEREAAPDYGVSHSTFGKVRARTAWSHVQ